MKNNLFLTIVYLSLMGVMLLGMTSCSNRRQNAMSSDSDEVAIDSVSPNSNVEEDNYTYVDEDGYQIDDVSPNSNAEEENNINADEDERQIGEMWEIDYFTDEFGEEDIYKPFLRNDWVRNNYTILYQRFYFDSAGVPGLVMNILYSEDKDLYKVEGPANFAVKAGNGEIYKCVADKVFDGNIIFFGDKALQIGRIYEMHDLKISLEVELYLERKRFIYSSSSGTNGLAAGLRRLAKKYK